MIPPRAQDIGVVIPTCGIRPELWETLDSVFAACAKCPPREVIVCVNAGPDSVPIVEMIQARVGARARVVVADPAMQISMFQNWNFCVSQVTAPYVHLLHDDDMVSPYFYDAVGELIDQYPEGVLYSTALIAFGERKEFHSGFPISGIWEGASEYLKKRNAFFCPSMVIRKASFAGFETKWSAVADWKAWHDLAVSGPVVCSMQALAYYRVHAASATSRLEAEGTNVIEVCELLRELQKEEGRPDMRFAAEVGYGAALRAANGGDLKTMILQLKLGQAIAPSIKQILRCAYSFLKTRMRKV